MSLVYWWLVHFKTELGGEHQTPQNPIELFRNDIPDYIAQSVCNFYDGLQLVDGTITGEAPITQADIESDLEFWLANQNIPAENVCSRMDNYHPKNTSQEALVNAANFLIHEGATQRAMGLIAHGAPGLGKTHISVGMAKELSKLQQGRVTYFNAGTGGVNMPSDYSRYTEYADDGKGTIILDDVNNPYGSGARALRSAVSAVHDTGGRLFVTSNAENMEEFLQKALKPPADSEGIDFRRLIDRVRGMLLFTKLIGSSHRAETHQNPWGDFSSERDSTEAMNVQRVDETQQELGRGAPEIEGKLGDL